MVELYFRPTRKPNPIHAPACCDLAGPLEMFFLVLGCELWLTFHLAELHINTLRYYLPHAAVHYRQIVR